MNLHTLKEFHHAVSSSFNLARDALLNIVDALSSGTAAKRFPALSLLPLFQRKGASEDKAREADKSHADRLRDVFVQFAPLSGTGQHAYLGVDTSSLYRREAETSADRARVPILHVPECDRVVCPGRVIRSIVLLPEKPGQGACVLDTRCISSSGLATKVAASQLLAVVDVLVQSGVRPVVIGDCWSTCAPFLARLTDVAASCLRRVKRHSIFFCSAPPRQPGQRGPSRKDGDRFPCSNESTLTRRIGATFEGTDPSGKRVEVGCWTSLHLRTARWVDVSVIRVICHGASEKKYDPRISRCVWKGDEPAPLTEIPSTSRVRSSHEQRFRLDKQELPRDEPRLRTPQHIERWTHSGACTHNQWESTRPLVETQGLYRPWEPRRGLLTLGQVRPAMPTLLTPLGAPAQPPQPRCKAPGRAKGFHPKPAACHPVIRQTSKTQKKRKTVSSPCV